MAQGKTLYAFYNERSRYGGEWGDLGIYRVLKETKYFLKVRKWLFFSEWIPKQGLGMKLMELRKL